MVPHEYVLPMLLGAVTFVAVLVAEPLKFLKVQIGRVNTSRKAVPTCTRTFKGGTQDDFCSSPLTLGSNKLANF
jgi:hypothetical protein